MRNHKCNQEPLKDKMTLSSPFKYDARIAAPAIALPRSFVAKLDKLCRFRAVAVVLVLLIIAINKSSVDARKI
jgi:hypothetical protein